MNPNCRVTGCACVLFHAKNWLRFISGKLGEPNSLSTNLDGAKQSSASLVLFRLMTEQKLPPVAVSLEPLN